MESWDADDFEPQEPKKTVPGATNKWEGEDEDDDVKDCWEDEEEEEEKEKEKEQDENAQPVTPPPKAKKSDRIAEKERLKREELEKRLREAEEEEVTPEERLRMQKESDLKLALETTFGGDHTTTNDIDLGTPTTKEEFDEFANNLMKKIQPLAKTTEYPNFSENLIRRICATLTSYDLKKVKTTIDNIYLEKQKLEKGDKAKKNKGKGKVKLKVEDSNQYSAYAVDDYNEFDDFM